MNVSGADWKARVDQQGFGCQEDGGGRVQAQGDDDQEEAQGIVQEHDQVKVSAKHAKVFRIYCQIKSFNLIFTLDFTSYY